MTTSKIDRNSPPVKKMPLLGKVALSFLALAALLGSIPKTGQPVADTPTPTPTQVEAAPETQAAVPTDEEAWDWANSGRLSPEVSELAYESRGTLMLQLLSMGRAQFEGEFESSCTAQGMPLDSCRQEASDLASTLYRYADAKDGGI